MQVPLSILLIPFAIMFLIGFIFFLINTFHLARFGLQSAKTTALISAYLIGFLVTTLISGALLLRYDWSASIELSDIQFQGDINDLTDL